MNENLGAKEYFNKKDYKNALKLFSKQKDCYFSGLCCLMLGKARWAKKYWTLDKTHSPASDWGLCILDLINLKTPKKIPSFFQTRAQLEIYLNLLIEGGHIEWAQNLVSSADFFYGSNPESYKFIARALWANGYFRAAIVFCEKSLQVFWSDPEAFLILSQSKYLLGDIEGAKDALTRTLNIAGNYYPAILFKKIIEQDLKKVS